MLLLLSTIFLPLGNLVCATQSHWVSHCAFSTLNDLLIKSFSLKLKLSLPLLTFLQGQLNLPFKAITVTSSFLFLSEFRQSGIYWSESFYDREQGTQQFAEHISLLGGDTTACVEDWGWGRACSLAPCWYKLLEMLSTNGGLGGAEKI